MRMRKLLSRSGSESDSQSVAPSETQSEKAHRHELLARVQSRLAGIIGLGALPPVIPPGTEHRHCINKRPVFIAWHPVADNLGVLFAEHTRLGQAITREMGEFPDPTNHWAVLVGDQETDYYHELWMEKDFTVINQHGVVGTQKWTNKLKVGDTRYNDQAVLAASDRAIKKMKPRYGLIDNNCQIFCGHLLLELGITMGENINTARDMTDKLLAEFSKVSWQKKLADKDWQIPTFLKVKEIRRSISPAFGGRAESPPPQQQPEQHEVADRNWQTETFLKVKEISRSISPAFGRRPEEPPQGRTPEPHEEMVMQERKFQLRPFSWGKKKEVVAQLPTPP
ncbi:hypothetical protein B0T20DRAFT_24375 [Sordaria brevicollis]|uniref:Uncharacterized protein n=1 Tax=Sordaria brevicollis TaxID=83679 RepID=A0AAE0PNR8_SORBR|nr:hypothetical protein B0T20DRAFT_24375 [Sordaria brevicollis]